MFYIHEANLIIHPISISAQKCTIAGMSCISKQKGTEIPCTLFPDRESHLSIHPFGKDTHLFSTTRVCHGFLSSRARIEGQALQDAC